MLYQATPPESLFWQGLVYSGIAIVFVILSVWVLFLSRIEPVAVKKRVLPNRLMLTIILLIGLSGFLRFLGAFWDSSEHLVTGIVPGGDDFFWPPHIAIYLSFIFSMMVVMIAALEVSKPYRRKKIFDPRHWVRDYPEFGAIVLSGVYALLAAPGDALWHELFGFDLTGWSPPHVFLALASGSEIIAAAALLLKVPVDPQKKLAKNLGMTLLLGLALNIVYMIGVIDWEIPAEYNGSMDLVLQRPVWAYPLVSAGLALFVIVLARKLTGMRWAGTITTLFFYAIRMSATYVIQATGGISLNIPLFFILGAVFFDVLAHTPPINTKNAVISLGFTAGFYALAYPALADEAFFFTFTLLDHLVGVAAIWILGLIFIPLAQRSGQWFLVRSEAAHKTSLSPTPQQAIH